MATIGMVGSGLSSMGTIPGYKSLTSDEVTRRAMQIVGGPDVWNSLDNNQRLAAMRNVRSNDRRAFTGEAALPWDATAMNSVYPTSAANPAQTASMYGGSQAENDGYTPPQPAAGSATATNPFLNIGLNAFTNTQQPYNPQYLDSVSQSLWNQANQNWNDVINPSINNASIVAGGYGGDRAAIAKGVAADRLNESVFNAMAPQYLADYNAWQNRALQGGNAAAGVGTGLEQLDLNRTLGMGNLNLGMYSADTQRQLGLGDLAAKNLLTEANVAQMANQTANPQYSNPLGAGIGGGLLAWQVLNSILNPQG